MAADRNFAMFAAQYDTAIRAGADTAMYSLLVRVADLIPYIAVPLVMIWGVMLAVPQSGLTLGRALGYILRLAVVLWLIVGLAYVPYVRDFFVDTLPNEFATVVVGGGTITSSAEQFDRLDEASAHYTARIKAQATGWFQIGDRIAADVSRGWAKFWLELMFYIWLTVRLMTYLVVTAFAALVPLLLFESTRHLPMEMIGKLVGLAVWQLVMSILLSVTVAGTQVFLRSMLTTTGASIDEQLEGAWDIGGWFLGCFVLLLTVPAVAGIGSGYTAGSAAQGAVIGMATKGAALASRGAAAANAAVSRGSRAGGRK